MGIPLTADPQCGTMWREMTYGRRSPASPQRPPFARWIRCGSAALPWAITRGACSSCANMRMARSASSSCRLALTGTTCTLFRVAISAASWTPAASPERRPAFAPALAVRFVSLAFAVPPSRWRASWPVRRAASPLGRYPETGRRCRQSYRKNEVPGVCCQSSVSRKAVPVCLTRPAGFCGHALRRVARCASRATGGSRFAQVRQTARGRRARC